MKRAYGRVLFLLLLFMMSTLCLSGCKASKKKVESSKYYQDLLSKYEKLKKENDILKKANENQEQVSDAEAKSEQREKKFLYKIARDTLVKLEVGYVDDMDECVEIPVTGMYAIATQIAERADRTTKYKPEELESEFESRYEYVLYDENNAVYEIYIYGSDYVVFGDLPKSVYYVPGASVLGDAFLFYRTAYPSSSLLHRMADSPIMTDSKGRYYENYVALATANYIDDMKKEKSSRDDAEKVWKKKAGYDEYDEDVRVDKFEPKSMTYTYYLHGNKLELTMYDEYISLRDVDGEHTWYKVSKADIQGIKDILKADRDARTKNGQSQDVTPVEDEEKTDAETDHSKEIEEESIID